MPGQPFVQIDAFTRESFGGNPAAVFLLPSGRDEGWMQRVAREMNQADTAFLVRRDDVFDLRWFTREELRGNGDIILPGKTSIARAIIEGWLGAPIDSQP